MKRQLKILPQADADLEAFAEHIAEDNFPAANRLFDAAEETFLFLADSPFAGEVAGFKGESVRDLRLWRITGYPNHITIYRVTDNSLIIVRVVHAAQDRDRIFSSDPE